MLVLKILFWLLLGIVFYTYVGYGILLWILVRLPNRKNGERKLPENEHLPRVAHIIAAYNEQDFITSKISNSLAMDYPREKMRIIIVADGSSDDTVTIASRFPEVELLYEPARRGKVAAINRAVAATTGVDILIFSDANTLLNPDAFRLIASHYTDPRVGGVSGEKKVIGEGQAPGKGEGLYWKYESVLKKLDSDFYSVVGAAGELFSVRRELFEDVPEEIILDDFYISLNVNRKGLLVRYEPGAYAMEAPSFSMKEERKRKVRISAGAFQSMSLTRDLMNLFSHGKLAFSYLSHRVLRWAVCPFALPVLLVANVLICLLHGGDLYFAFLILQVAFYLFAVIGWLQAENGRPGSKIFYVPYYFVFMNVSVWAGLRRYLQGSQSSAWEKARRSIPA